MTRATRCDQYTETSSDDGINISNIDSRVDGVVNPWAGSGAFLYDSVDYASKISALRLLCAYAKVKDVYSSTSRADRSDLMNEDGHDSHCPPALKASIAEGDQHPVDVARPTARERASFNPFEDSP